MFYFEFRILNPDLKSIFVGSILKEIFECIVRVFLNSFCLYISIFAIFNLKIFNLKKVLVNFLT